MKTWLSVVAAVAFGAGLAVNGRYDIIQGKDMIYPMRLDRWTGRIEVVLPKISPELRGAVPRPQASTQGDE